LTQFTQARRKLAFLRNQHRQPLLDGKPDFTARANELLLIASKRTLASRIERTAKLSEEGVVHVFKSLPRAISPSIVKEDI
jgi:hypothetical protein